MKITAPKCRYRPIVETDEAAIGEILADWNHDNINAHRGNRFDSVRLTNTVNRWLLDASVEPPEIPLKTSSLFRQALLMYMDATSVIDSPPDKETPVGLAVFVARGKTIHVELTAIHPTYRGKKLYSECYPTLSKYAFVTLGADDITWQIPTNVAAGKHATSKWDGFTTAAGQTTGETGARDNYSMTKTQWQARLDDASGQEFKDLDYAYSA